MMEIIGQIPNLSDLHQWAEQQPVSELIRSSYAAGRLECYYGLGVKLTREPVVKPAPSDPRVTKLGDRLLPDWDSALLCKYAPGVGIAAHRDHGCFEAMAVIVNIGEADFFVIESGQKTVHPLKDGTVIRVNTKVTHGVEPVVKTRYSLTFRHIKGQYLTPSLF